MESQLVWAPHTEHGYVLGRVIDLKSGTNNLATIRIECNQPIILNVNSNRHNNNRLIIKDEQTIECSIENVFPSEIDLQAEYDDNCSLMYLNEGNLLHNIRQRYFKNKIYVSYY
ncbi:hypothetical protein BLA29_013595 [Euroglyphus maynei]|uniref:Myosin motor domain-containing protein n=1 Tax=Euroglyphus maynei TaxID=6958 RepID=A0A1Y3BNX9_EURMA|nr:hypothetical protein BLA29_013595 [Euroglyphus maynei]